VTLGRAVVIADQQVAKAGVEAPVLAQDLVGPCRHRGERDGHEWRTLVQGDELVDAADDPVGEGIDAPAPHLLRRVPPINRSRR
jgi:hypothetical protein